MPAADPTMNGVQFLKGTKFLSVGDFANHILSKWETSYDGEQERIKNGDGQTITVVYFDDVITITFEVLIKKTGAFTLGARGSALTLDGLTFYLKTKRRLYGQAVATWEATFEHFPNLGATD